MLQLIPFSGRHLSIKQFQPSSLLIILFSMLFLMSGCKQDAPKDSELNYSLETAELVSQVTSGLVQKDAEIEVRFSSPVIKENLVNESLQKNVFTFDPPIEGVTRWKDRQTLTFTPSEDLTARTNYSATLDVAALLPLHKETLESFPFAFEVAGRELSKIEHDFELVNKDDASKLHVVGTVEFSEPIGKDLVKKAVTLKRLKRGMPLTWSGSGKTFSFKSEVVTRGKSTQNFNLNIDKDPVDISQSLNEEFVLSPLTNLSVTSVKKEGSGDKVSIIVQFSDELDAAQDLQGLIRTEPAASAKVKVVGKNAYLSGNFNFGQDYEVLVSKGVRSRFGTKTSKLISEVVKLADLKPQIKFSGDGVFMPTANKRSVRFQSLNVKSARFEIKRVFESNLGQFLQTQDLNGSASRNSGFNYYIDRVGVVVHTDTLDLGTEKNSWKQHELDLSKIISREDKGLYLLSVRFSHNDMLYGTAQEMADRNKRYYYGEEYTTNPYSPGYPNNWGQIYKPVIASDIGLTYKRGHKQHVIYATDINTAEPMSGVNVTLRSYQHQPIVTGVTDSRGYVEFGDIGKDQLFTVEGERGGERSVIKLQQMRWNLSTFDTDGESTVPGGTRAFIYTERGVYRPGDEVNISTVVRNEENSFPDNHPVEMIIYNPRNQKVFEKTNTTSEDGFYNFTYQGAMDDPTGTYRVSVKAGASYFTHDLKIETVVPFRLKVNLTPEKKTLSATDKRMNIDFNSTYLFGNPAAGLKAEADVILQSVRKQFPKYKNFIFQNGTVNYQPVRASVFSGNLDANGNAKISWKLPKLTGAPSSLRADVSARVFEKGGRANLNSLSIPIETYSHYVGLQRPETRWGYVKLGSKIDVPFVLLDADGKEAPGKQLTYRIYASDSYWWWEYDSRNSYLLRFKSSSATKLEKEGKLVSQGVAGILSYTPEREGSFLIEVQDGETGHSSAFMILVDSWGSSASGKDAGVLALSADKDKYDVGETAVISFPAPAEGSVLLSIEKEQKIISSRWIALQSGNEMKVEIPVTEEMLPTTYASISIIQPHAQTANDRPLRMYGVVPLNVEQAATHQAIRINMPDELRSNAPFKIEVQTEDGEPTQFTIAVVDEGLLDLTRFDTPDAWKHFFRKLRLGVESFDLFAQVLGAHKGDVFRTFSIGGGLASKFRSSQLESGKKKRFKPVSMFKGPITTDRNGKAVVEFTMPNYVGSVRAMVVSATGNRYGKAEKAVPVKTELMAVSSFPRAMAPGDKISVPVTVFAMKEGIGEVDVTVKTTGPLKVVGEGLQKLTFAKTGDQDVSFNLQADAAIGQSKIIVEARSGSYKSVNEIDMYVRPSSARVFDNEDKTIDKGSSVKMLIPNRGLPGSNVASISIRRRPNTNFSSRILYLIRYPYGCIEQTTSSVFPQLYLKGFLKGLVNENKVAYRNEDIDRNINRGIERLHRFQLSSGGFSYWPGNTDVSEWGTLYATHFMVEAGKKGYSVSDVMLNNALRYLRSKAKDTKDNIKTRVYRVYVLARAGKADIGAMNLLRENEMSKMNNSNKWLLGSAYLLAGQKEVAGRVVKETGFTAEKYSGWSFSYGSENRDRAMILEQLVAFERWTDADKLASELSLALSNRSYWYSTQTTGYMLMAIGKYLDALEGKEGSTPRMKGNIVLPDGERVAFDTDKFSFDRELLSGFGKEVTIELDKSSTTARAFLSLDWNGVPLKSDVKTDSKSLKLNLEWLDNDGAPINPAALKQGTTFWAHYSVSPARPYKGRIDEIALVQVLPSGWEIENTRLSGEALPGWASKWRINNYDYLDIRDDRIMWFFDLRNRNSENHFLVKLNAVTVGDFELPGTIVEAMYNNDFRASIEGKAVSVLKK
ncbi:MAG: MG2 domain-containing protein [Calditrichia bacterium]